MSAAKKHQTMFADVDALTTQAHKNGLAQDEAETAITHLAEQLVKAAGDPAEQRKLADHIKEGLDLIAGADYHAKMVEWTKTLADSEKALKDYAAKAQPAAAKK